jgi:apocytochrome f
MEKTLESYIKAVKKFLLTVGCVISCLTFSPRLAMSYPIFAQQAYENPREATGRIVCANCHLAQKPVEIETPQAVLPDTVFEAVVRIPYDLESKQVLANGTKGGLNVGAVMILPEGFKLAPKDRLSKELKQKMKGLYIQPYNRDKPNILVIGPITGDKNQEITFPILSPDPKTDKQAHYLTYPIFLGGNRGRGQVYPSGDKSNNVAYNSPINGQITKVEALEKGGFSIKIQSLENKEITQNIPTGLELKITEKDFVQVDQPLTRDPNVGGFGQTETEVVLQNPTRIIGMIAFFFTIILAQIFLVLKKKQFEKVQAAEMNF